MKTFLFFAYRDWAVNIFRRLSQSGDRWILLTKESECTEDFINKIQPDIIFFYGWSWIVPSHIVEAYPCLCLHPSLLPEYRGGSPIQNQIINGGKTGITIFKMNNNLDSGRILFQQALSFDGYLDEVFRRIENVGVKGTQRILDDYTWDYVRGWDQKEEDATYCKRRTPQESEIKPGDWTQHDAKYFYDMVRCLQPPYPEVYVQCKEGKLIIERVRYE